MNPLFPPSRSLALLLLLLLLCLPASAQVQIGAGAAQRIHDILEMKKTFTPEEQKMTSNLVLASRAARGLPLGPAAGLLNNRNIKVGMIDVEFHATVSNRLVQAIAAQGGRVHFMSAPHRHIHASVPVGLLHLLAGHPDVTSVRELPGRGNSVGSVTTQGIVSHGVKALQAAGVIGAGVNVGVISDSASAAQVAKLQASGDLGANTTVVPGQDGATPGFTDEGCAMMEIVHDMAPGANLFFATSGDTQAQFAANITTLSKPPYNCTIIVDDIFFFSESVFQDNVIAQSVNSFVASGGLYFSAATNWGNVTHTTSGTWEGDFLDGGPIDALLSGGLSSKGGTGKVHNFGTAGSPQLANTVSSPSVRIELQWSDPLGASNNDYDLFELDSTGTVINASSFATQNGTQDPYEEIVFPSGPPQVTSTNGDLIVVVLSSGSPRALHLSTPTNGILTIATTGTTFGHMGGANSVSMAATYWDSAKTGTRPFDGIHNVTESFSSDGPRRIFYNPNGTAITPGNVLFATNGGTLLMKPDLTAANGVSTTTPGFIPFFGTSAAAPHAAAIAALIRGVNPALTSAQILQIMKDTAMGHPGMWNRDSGYGVINAAAAVQQAGGP